MQIALVVFPGVSVNECEAFSLAFRQVAASGLGHCDLIGVGAAIGDVVGVGGRQIVDATFDEVTNPDVVIVPGGLGVERTAHDEPLLAWLRSVAPQCQWVAASSTGTVVVAAAGLLGDRPAATHWLAGGNLAAYGSQPSAERVVEVGRVLTCHGHVSAVDVALLMIVRLFNREIATQVRRDLTEAVVAGGRPDRSAMGRWTAWWTQRLGGRIDGRDGDRRRRADGQPRPKNEELDMSPWVEMELAPLSGEPSTQSGWDRPA